MYAVGIWSCGVARSLVWEKVLQELIPREVALHTTTTYDEGMLSWAWTSIVSGLLEERFQASYETVLERGFIQEDHFDVAPEGS
jgi:hypothetical protein